MRCGDAGLLAAKSKIHIFADDYFLRFKLNGKCIHKMCRTICLWRRLVNAWGHGHSVEPTLRWCEFRTLKISLFCAHSFVSISTSTHFIRPREEEAGSYRIIIITYNIVTHSLDGSLSRRFSSQNPNVFSAATQYPAMCLSTKNVDDLVKSFIHLIVFWSWHTIHQLPETLD